MQRHPPLPVPLGARHLSAAKAARALDPDPERTGLLRILDGPFHRPSKSDPAGKLVGHTLCNERRLQLGFLNLLDVECHGLVAGDLRQPSPQPVSLGALATDDDPRACCVDVDAHSFASTFHLDPADRRVCQILHDVLTDLPVLDEVVRILLPAGKPPRLPVGGDT